jgi:predicted nucleic acid-binding protein
MKSLDTNVLLYALNADCAEHVRARATVEHALREYDQWIIADQVYFELYRLLRNPAVLSRPLAADEAAETVGWYRNRSGWLHCAYEPGMMKQVSSLWSDKSFPGRNTFDLVLAVTLGSNGVREFLTRNADDFLAYDLFIVRNPIDGS